MQSIVIVGSGPVGSFMAVLCRMLQFEVTVFEKREKFTRNINLKLESSLFEETMEVLSRLNLKSRFFTLFYGHLKEQKDRILIKDFEERFTTEAKALGVKYITKEVLGISELYEDSEYSESLILDCSGRNSKLRSSVFGPDEYNIVSVPLQNAMYINFKAKVSGDLSLYQVMKYVPNVKLTEVVFGKQQDSNGFCSVTIPVFITKQLAGQFDRECPNINRKPINPFSSENIVSDRIFFPVSSLVGNLMMDGCQIDMESVSVKKIVISCGYAKGRSRYKLVCLGDSAAHLAFFKSLNLGLKHTLELFIILSRFSEGTQAIPSNDDVVEYFKRCFPHLNPIRAYRTSARNVFLVVTKVIWYGCYSFNYTNKSAERLTYVTGVYEDQVYEMLVKHNERLSRWSDALSDFEAKREGDIQREIQSNQTKNIAYEFTSTFIDLNGLSVIKISEVFKAIKGQHALLKKDFDFLLKCFKTRRDVLKAYKISADNNDTFIHVVLALLNQLPTARERGFHSLMDICTKNNVSSEENITLINSAIYRSSFPKCIKGALIARSFSSGIFEYSCIRSNFVLSLIKNELYGIKKLDPEPIPLSPEPLYLDWVLVEKESLLTD
ncbi:hypothetical protein JTE90_001903 [Oedothorax gibbosus]|uniref:Kynurenine 3-monooxygenase n=1 Tax=Oedothorax gibbosus TaxID=931172 RepID=A0AAV6VVC1_9ARAC|nr:hypothetical protein JTE90_001903 [Oedothorax gibbosus]